MAVIMTTAYSDSDRTIAAMKIGAFDYLAKPFDLDALLATVARAVRAPRAAKIETADVEPTFIGKSSAMREVWKTIGRAAPRNVSVLITGEVEWEGAGGASDPRSQPSSERPFYRSEHGGALAGIDRERALRTRKRGFHGCARETGGTLRARFTRNAISR
jgi:hypothetical protein